MTDTEVRDHFAGLAMQALIADKNNVTWDVMCDLLGEDKAVMPSDKYFAALLRTYTSRLAYLQADSMMCQRKKP